MSTLVDAAVAVDLCPACGSAQRQAMASACAGFGHRLGEAEFFQPDYDIQLCTDCSLAYKSPRPSDEALGKYYQSAPYEDYGMDVMFPTDRAVLGMLGKGRTGLRVLDVGCSAGRVSGLLTDHHEVCGVEPNKRASEIARARGIDARPSLDEFESEGAKFDVILLMDVFEHLTEPVGYCRRITSLLAEGGSLIMVTGLLDVPEFERAPEGFWYHLLYGHVVFLTSSHVAILARQLGLTAAERHVVSHYDARLHDKAAATMKAGLHRWTRRLKKLGAQPVLERLPVFSRSVRWTWQPPVTHTRDHVVLRLEKPKA